MAYAFITASDSLYMVEDGRLSRIGQGPVVRQDGSPHPDADKLQGVRVRVLAAPRIGASACFSIPSGDFEGRLTTSRIKAIIPIADVAEL